MNFTTFKVHVRATLCIFVSMKKANLLISGIFFCRLLTYGQNEEILWASEVLDYSSQPIDGKVCAAREVLGKPNSMLPGGVLSATAWYPYSRNAKEYVWVKFAKKIKAKQVIICQNYNAGGIISIEGFDDKLKPYLIVERNPSPVPAKTAEVLHYAIPVDVPAIHAIKVTLIGNDKKYYYQQIDAIGITESSTLVYQPKIDLIENIKFPSAPEKLDENINSPYGEDDPIVSADGKILFVNRHNHPENTEVREIIATFGCLKYSLMANGDLSKIWVVRSISLNLFGPAGLYLITTLF